MPKQSKIAHELVGIGEVLRMRQLKVPVYQRPYSWNTDEVGEYWTDLRGALNAKAPEYFLGSIVVTTEGDDNRLTIIDGQQRLATTAMLLASIRDAYRAKGENRSAGAIQSEYIAGFDVRTQVDEPKLELSDQDDSYFRNLVIDDSGAAAPSPTHESHAWMLRAREFLRGRIDSEVAESGTRWLERLAQWVEFVKDGVVVMRVEVPTESDAFLIFETLNDRGRNLTLADLLKNYLFGLARGRLDVVKRSWISAVSLLETAADSEIVVNFLRQYWSSKHGLVRERELYKSMKARVTSEQQAVDLAAELQAGARFYAALLNSDHEYWAELGTAARGNVQTLLRLGLEQNRPLLLAVMQHFQKPEMKKLLRSLVSWSVRGLVVGGIGGGTTERYYSEAAAKVRQGEIKTTEDLAAQLSPIIPSDAAFQASFATVRVTSTRLARYYLRALEQSDTAEPEMVPNSDEEEVNLEHVLPRAAMSSSWPGFSADEIPEWASRLGNLVLLKKSQNERLGNKPYEEKLPVLRASDLKTTKLAAVDGPWSREAIEKRQAALAELALRVWPMSVSI